MSNQIKKENNTLVTLNVLKFVLNKKDSEVL